MSSVNDAIRNAIKSSSTDNNDDENDESYSMYDTMITCKDNVQIPAVRFLLGAHSNVMRKMLYGNFKEARSKEITLDQYSQQVIGAVVEYTYTGDIESFDKEYFVEMLVELCGCADYLEINLLVGAAISKAQALMEKDPSITCTIYEDCNGSINPSVIRLKILAFDLIVKDPERTLLVSDNNKNKKAGVACLSEVSIKEVFGNDTIKNYSNKVSLMTALSDWVSFDNDTLEFAKKVEVAKECVSCIDLSTIKTSKLVELAKECCGFLTNEKLVETYSKQALLAEKVGFDVCNFDESKANIPRVIVTGAGILAVNGTYFMDGKLNNWPKYTKPGCWDGKPTTFVIYKYNSRNWYIAKIAEDGSIGAGDDDFYNSKIDACRPPSSGWSKCTLGKEPSPLCDISKAVP